MLVPVLSALTGPLAVVFLSARWLHLNLLLLQPVIVTLQLLTPFSGGSGQGEFFVPSVLPHVAATKYSF